MKHNDTSPIARISVTRYLLLGSALMAIILDTSWVVPAIALLLALGLLLAQRMGYFSREKRPSVVSTSTLLTTLAWSTVYLSIHEPLWVILPGVLPLFSRKHWIPQISAALIGAILILMTAPSLTTAAALIGYGLLALTLISEYLRSTNDEYAISTPISDRSSTQEVASSSGSNEYSITEVLNNLAGSTATAVYRYSPDDDTVYLQRNSLNHRHIQFDAELPERIQSAMFEDPEPLLWYRPEQCSEQRLHWLQSDSAITAVAMAPIVIEARTRGLVVHVYTSTNQPEQWTTKQARSAQYTAQQTAQLLAEITDAERRNAAYEEERVGYQVITTAAETLNRAQTTEASERIIVQLLRDLTGSDAVALYRFRAESISLHLQHAQAFGTTASVPREASPDSLMMEASRRDNWLPYRPSESLSAAQVFGKEGADFPCHSLLILPLTMDAQPVGVIALGSRQKNLYETDVRWRLRLVVSYLTFACTSIWRYEDTLEKATRDPLTGLLNRRSFVHQAEQAIERQQRSEESASVLMLDIDHFKQVNDTWGHQAGDEVIAEFAHEICQHTRTTDIVGRYGGEEFVVYLEDTSIDGAETLAERIRRGLAQRVFTFEGQELSVTTSVGSYTFDGKIHLSLEEAIGKADEALYCAKDRGRNQVISVHHNADRSEEVPNIV